MGLLCRPQRWRPPVLQCHGIYAKLQAWMGTVPLSLLCNQCIRRPARGGRGPHMRNDSAGKIGVGGLPTCALPPAPASLLLALAEESRAVQWGSTSAVS